MAKYVNITSGTSTTLLTKGTQYTGSISTLHLSNNSSSECVIDLFLHDGTNLFYFVKQLSIPAYTSLLLDDSLSFNIKKYDLKLGHTNNPNLTIIIK